MSIFGLVLTWIHANCVVIVNETDKFYQSNNFTSSIREGLFNILDKLLKLVSIQEIAAMNMANVNSIMANYITS